MFSGVLQGDFRRSCEGWALGLALGSCALSGGSGEKSLSLSWRYCWEFANVCVGGLVGSSRMAGCTLWRLGSGFVLLSTLSLSTLSVSLEVAGSVRSAGTVLCP